MREKIVYTVRATLPDEHTAAQYIAWLKNGHVQAVLAGGAESGQVIRVLGSPSESPSQADQHSTAESEAAPAPSASCTVISDRSGYWGQREGQVVVQAVYVFPSRAAFDTYCHVTAPALREDGIRKFGKGSGRDVSFERTLGVLV